MNSRASVVDFAFEIVRMDRRIMELEAEVEHLSYFKYEYFNLMKDSRNHTNKLFGIAMLGALGDIGGAQALADS